MATQSRAMIKEVADICWYMRGGITWIEAWQLTHAERREIAQTIKENIERTEKTGLALL